MVIGLHLEPQIVYHLSGFLQLLRHKLLRLNLVPSGHQLQTLLLNMPQLALIIQFSSEVTGQSIQEMGKSRCYFRDFLQMSNQFAAKWPQTTLLHLMPQIAKFDAINDFKVEDYSIGSQIIFLKSSKYLLRSCTFLPAKAMKTGISCGESS